MLYKERFPLISVRDADWAIRSVAQSATSHLNKKLARDGLTINVLITDTSRLVRIGRELIDVPKRQTNSAYAWQLLRTKAVAIASLGCDVISLIISKHSYQQAPRARGGETRSI